MIRRKTDNRVFETDWFSIDAVPQKKGKPYYRLSCADSAVVIARTIGRKLLLIGQFRPAVGEFMLEWPAGQVDDGESPRQAIQRELMEETGYSCKSLTFLEKFRVSPCRINSSVHLFFGDGAERIGGRAKSDKDIEVFPILDREFDKMMLTRAGNISVPVMGFYHFAKVKGLL